MRWKLVLAVTAALSFCTACSSHQPSAGGPSSPTASGTTESGQSPPGTELRPNHAIIGKNAVNPEELGLPLYPGAIPAETGALLMHSKSGTSQVMSLSTKDDFEQVYQWYKQRMPAGSEQAHMAVRGGSVASFLVGKPQDAEIRSVLITQESSAKTTILLTRQIKHARKMG